VNKTSPSLPAASRKLRETRAKPQETSSRRRLQQWF